MSVNDPLTNVTLFTGKYLCLAEIILLIPVAWLVNFLNFQICNQLHFPLSKLECRIDWILSRFGNFSGCCIFQFLCTIVSQNCSLQAASFGGSNIDPSAWEDKKCRGESRFPAQVKSRFMNLDT